MTPSKAHHSPFAALQEVLWYAAVFGPRARQQLGGLQKVIRWIASGEGKKEGESHLKMLGQ